MECQLSSHPHHKPVLTLSLHVATMAASPHLLFLSLWHCPCGLERLVTCFASSATALSRPRSSYPSAASLSAYRSPSPCTHTSLSEDRFTITTVRHRAARLPQSAAEARGTARAGPAPAPRPGQSPACRRAARRPIASPRPQPRRRHPRPPRSRTRPPPFWCSRAESAGQCGGRHDAQHHNAAQGGHNSHECNSWHKTGR